MTRRIAFINEKGGTGKTTLAVNVAAFFALKKQKKVLLVDLDTQGHAGKSLGIDVRTAEATVFSLLTDPTLDPQAVVRSTPVPGLSVIASWKDMAEFATRAAQTHRREFLLRDRLAPIAQAYDYVIFDAPPSLGLSTTNILLAADEVVIPVATTYLALDGCAEMVDTVDRIRTEYDHAALQISLVVPTMYRKTALADEIVSKLGQYFPRRVAEPLGFNVAIDESQSHGQTIWEYAPWSRGATLLQAIAEKIERVGRS